jgi:RHH-type proline utilization regulon transcriptional repressor/proline dehydrogenase/delta 1-pyrroline-5-carboxylate dehydrogenase
LNEVEASLDVEHLPLIGGEGFGSGAELLSVNPARPSQVIGRTSMISKTQAEEAVSEAKKAYLLWRDTNSGERASLLLRIAENLRSRRDYLAALQVYEVSKTWREADADVCEAIDFCEYYAREMMRLGEARLMDLTPGETNLYSYQPRGVALVLAPWNFPLAISTGMSTAALVTGNAVIYKPSRLSFVVGAELAKIVNEAGAPEGLFQYLPCSGSDAHSWLVQHPEVDLIAFTGSREVGLEILKSASVVQPGQREIKKVVAEMGGKNAVIVDADASLDAAVMGVAQSAFEFQGQKCSACSRAIVLEEAYDRFSERLLDVTRGMRIGDPTNPSIRVGAVIDAHAKERISQYIEIGKSEGHLLFQADAPDEGFFIGPTVFGDVLPHHRLAQEEIFGPVLALMRANDLDHAIEIANGTDYALTGGFYSRSPGNIERVKREFQVGNLYINRKITGSLVGRQPFGGLRMSGIGSKAGGPDYLLQFMESHTITESTLRTGFAPELEE